MEKALLEKWKNHQMDDVDKAMFDARLSTARNAFANALEKVHDCIMDYEDELNILCVTMILFVGSTIDPSPVGHIKSIEGDRKLLCKYTQEIAELLKEDANNG